MWELRAQRDAIGSGFPVCLREMHVASIADVAGFLLKGRSGVPASVWLFSVQRGALDDCLHGRIESTLPEELEDRVGE